MNYEAEDIMETLNVYKRPLIFIDDCPIGLQLRVKRVAEGYDQVQLAKILGMSVGTLSEIETGSRKVP
jgi:DNA-binding XRE family transcriptional regulator